MESQIIQRKPRCEKQTHHYFEGKIWQRLMPRITRSWKSETTQYVYSPLIHFPQMYIFRFKLLHLPEIQSLPSLICKGCSADQVRSPLGNFVCEKEPKGRPLRTTFDFSLLESSDVLLRPCAWEAEAGVSGARSSCVRWACRHPPRIIITVSDYYNNKHSESASTTMRLLQSV